MQQLSLVWDLDVFFKGGSASTQFKQFMGEMKHNVDRFRQDVITITDKGTQVGQNELYSSIVPLVELLQKIMFQLRESSSFVECLMAENQHDRKALQLNGVIASISADFTSALTRFDQLLSEIAESDWLELLATPPLDAVAFALNERRTLAKDKLSPELESLIGDLAVDGYHGWGEAYNTAVGKINIPYEQDGKMIHLSAGQAANKLSSPDRAERINLFQLWEKAWAEASDYTADALNRLGGFRLQVYKHRGWNSVLKEPLQINRMSKQTLQVMWDVIEKGKPVFVKYLQRKAELLGIQQLTWHDVEAPIGEAALNISYQEAAELIVEQFQSFSPKLAQFSKKAFADRWIEAEDRSGKRPGGFCTSFPMKEQTRIFMTYANQATSVSTLAHELGHAYHQHVMNDMPALAQEYAMNVAETASTLAELIVSDAALKHVQSPEERLVLLEDKIQRSVAFFMNIHARFLFETRFYEERRDGLVSVERLNELMEEAQREAYHNSLSEYHPHFWSSKLHFYITEVPFYNFPYTFGYLFSAGIYAFAQQAESDFEDRYIALLRDTGSMTVEELAEKHLGIDLTQPEFWQNAVQLAIQDVDQFLELTK